jgi:BirA family biotin operon repressor/biotin-[acetyl-CoA-carboxylase] ligase
LAAVSGIALDGDLLRRALVTDLTWWRGVEVLAATGSTNADLAARARSGAAAPQALLTGNQTAGRGRLDRRWVAPPDSGIACSVLLRPARPVERWTWLPLLTGVAVVAAVRAATGVDAVLKWPNDVLTRADERKLCGVLVERVETPDGPACVVGMGLNVALTADQLPVPTATSLALAGATALDRTDLALALLRAVERAVRAWETAADDTALAAAYAERCVTLGRPVRVQLATGDVTGTAEAVDAGGRLVVATATGPRTFSAGDVVHLR